MTSLISSVGWGVTSLISMFILTAKNSSIYGWNRNELLLLTGIYGISIGIFHTVFSRNFDRFSKVIHRAELDSLLLKPIDSQFLISFSLFQFLGIIRILIGVIFTAYILNIMHLQISIISFVLFISLIIFGICLMYAIWFGVITATVWASNLDNLKDFLYQFNNLGRYPSDLIYKTGNVLLYLLIPLTYVASIPVKNLINRTNYIEVFAFFLITFLLFIASRKFWQFALKFYTSASG